MSTLKVNNLQVGQDATATNNFTLYQPAVPDGTVRLGIGNAGSVSDALTLKSNGSIGIGTTNPGYKLHTSDSGGTIGHQLTSNSNTIRYTNTNTTAEWSAGTSSPGIANAGNYYSITQFGTDSTWRERLVIDSNGNVNVKDGNLVIGTSGKGIDFSATADGSGTSSSELFDDYEEGTWTPTFYLNGILQSYIVDIDARYLKIGKLVYLEFWVGFGAYGQTSFPSGANTPFEIGGLPYTVNQTSKPGSLGNARTQGGLSANFSIGANAVQRICFWGTGGNFSNWSGVGKLQANQISSNTDVVVAGSYSYYN